jgi:hypothetical protein
MALAPRSGLEALAKQMVARSVKDAFLEQFAITRRQDYTGRTAQFTKERADRLFFRSLFGLRRHSRDLAQI